LEIDHKSQWPAPGATAQPGAPGTETFVFETLDAGESVITVSCACLAEQGETQEVRGEFVLNVDAQ
jgi:hypothetical protein